MRLSQKKKIQKIKKINKIKKKKIRLNFLFKINIHIILYLLNIEIFLLKIIIKKY